VVVRNAQDIKVSGNKVEEKSYRYHTGYPGGLRTIPFKNMLRDVPENVSFP